MTLDAELVEATVSLRDPLRVHRPKHRILRRVRMHAATPLFVVALVTTSAILWRRIADGWGLSVGATISQSTIGHASIDNRVALRRAHPIDAGDPVRRLRGASQNEQREQRDDSISLILKAPHRIDYSRVLWPGYTRGGGLTSIINRVLAGPKRFSRTSFATSYTGVDDDVDQGDASMWLTSTRVIYLNGVRWVGCDEGVMPKVGRHRGRQV